MSCTVTTPSVADFTAWLLSSVAVPQSVISVQGPLINDSFCQAKAQVNYLLCVSPVFYRLALYNLATDIMMNYGVDQAGETPADYFACMQRLYNLNAFSGGVVASAGDSGTSASVTVPTSLSDLTLSDLQNLKTPWGRAYLAIAQKTGTNWGLT